MAAESPRSRSRLAAARSGLLFVGAAAALLALPQLLSPSLLILLCHALVLALACLGVNLLLGLGGPLSLGQASYFGIGAYAGAFLYR